MIVPVPSAFPNPLISLSSSSTQGGIATEPILTTLESDILAMITKCNTHGISSWKIAKAVNRTEADIDPALDVLIENDTIKQKVCAGSIYYMPFGAIDEGASTNGADVRFKSLYLPEIAPPTLIAPCGKKMATPGKVHIHQGTCRKCKALKNGGENVHAAAEQEVTEILEPNSCLNCDKRGFECLPSASDKSYPTCGQYEPKRPWLTPREAKDRRTYKPYVQCHNCLQDLAESDLSQIWIDSNGSGYHSRECYEKYLEEQKVKEAMHKVNQVGDALKAMGATSFSETVNEIEYPTLTVNCYAAQEATEKLNKLNPSYPKEPYLPFFDMLDFAEQLSVEAGLDVAATLRVELGPAKKPVRQLTVHMGAN